MLHRRTFLQGMFSAFAAPAIVRVDSLMPIRAPRMAMLVLEGFDPVTGDAICHMARIRELLLPGLWEITSRFPSTEEQWDKIFHAAD